MVVIPAPPEEVELARLARELRDVQSQIAQLQARSVQLVSTIDALGVTDTMSSSAWLAWTAGLTTGEARRQITLARRLPELPGLSAAFASGAISEGVAAALVRVATPANEAVLLETAEAATGPQLAKLVAEYKAVQPKATLRDPDETYFESFFDDHGRYDGRLRARADQGAQLDAAIRSVLEADQEATAGHDDGGGERMSRLDALIALAQDHLAGRCTAPNVLPQRFQAIVRVDETVLHPDHDDEGVGEACLAGACSLDPATARRLVCDAGIAALVERDGVAVATTSPARFATPAQLVALHDRDKTCRYPGCGRRVRLIAHHVTPHPVGPTALDNLVLLCEHHHFGVHRRGWSTRWEHRRGRRVLVIVQPDGTTVEPPDPPVGPPPAPPPPGERLTGTAEPLTFYARDVLLTAWMTADQHATDTAGQLDADAA
ncbi:MAG: DUF222 domain-containing protein [Acidimicrobiales bacterium]